jgi:NADPH-dependent ferric siderophore reductase
MAIPNTDSAQRHLSRRFRHEVVRRPLEVLRVQAVTPRMVRVTLGGEALRGFTSLGADDHVKVFFPQHGAPDVSRDYTPRRFDAAVLELDIDFVLHAEGPASDWARRVAVGDKLLVGGPRGSHVIANDFDWYLLAGDETAIPAIGRRLSELPANARAIVRIEVAEPEEVQTFVTSAALDIQWLARGSAPVGDSALLQAALRAVALPAGDGHAWLACESHTARILRQILVSERGLNREWVKAAGYWKLGAAGVHESVGD